MMWGPALNEPMTHLVPRVAPKGKTTLMWEPWSRSDSPRSASPTSYPHPGRSNPAPSVSPDTSSYAQTQSSELKSSHLRPLMHNSCERKKNQVKTNYHQGEISVYVCLSAPRLLPTEAEEITNSEQDVIHISAAEISIRGDSERFIISLQELPTHTRTRRGNRVR